MFDGIRITNERLITASGLSIAGLLLGRTELAKRLNECRPKDNAAPHIKNSDVAFTYNLILIATRVVIHARKTYLNLGRSNAWDRTSSEFMKRSFSESLEKLWLYRSRKRPCFNPAIFTMKP